MGASETREQSPTNSFREADTTVLHHMELNSASNMNELGSEYIARVSREDHRYLKFSLVKLDAENPTFAYIYLIFIYLAASS